MRIILQSNEVRALQETVLDTAKSLSTAMPVIIPTAEDLTIKPYKSEAYLVEVNDDYTLINIDSNIIVSGLKLYLKMLNKLMPIFKMVMAVKEMAMTFAPALRDDVNAFLQETRLTNEKMLHAYEFNGVRVASFDFEIPGAADEDTRPVIKFTADLKDNRESILSWLNDCVVRDRNQILMSQALTPEVKNSALNHLNNFAEYIKENVTESTDSVNLEKVYPA